VVGPEGDSELVTVAAGESGSREFPVTEDVEKTVTVTASGMEAVSATYTADCVPPVVEEPLPVASATVDCEGFVVLLDNSEGTADAVFTVVGPEGDSELVTVPAGESGSCEFPVTEDAEKTVTVTASGMEAVSATYTADCVPPVEALPTEILPAEAFAGVPAVPAVPAVAGVTGVLPQAGAGSSQWLPLLAFGMLAAGGVLLLTRRASRVSTNRRR